MHVRGRKSLIGEWQVPRRKRRAAGRKRNSAAASWARRSPDGGPPCRRTGTRSGAAPRRGSGLPRPCACLPEAGRCAP